MNAEYFISSNKLDDFVTASNWFITAQSKTPGAIEVTWPQNKPRDEKSQNFKQVVKYVPVCVAHKDGDVITADSFSESTKATFNKLPYGEYTVYVVAYLGDHSRNTSMTNWKKAARRSRSVTLKTMEGYPSQPPMNITATSTGTSSILVTWQPIAEEYANGILMGYEIYYGYDEKFLNTVVKVKIYGANSTSFEINDISDQMKYYIKVRGFTKRGVGPASPKVSATTGYEVRLTKRYGGLHALGNSSELSKAHTVWKLVPIGEEFDEILIVFKKFDLESSDASCSNNYVQVTDANDKEIGTFCGKKLPFATSIPKGSGVAQVTLRTNTVPDRGGFSGFYKVINEQPSNKNSVWNLQVQNTSRTGAEVSWDIPDGNVSDIMVLFKESSVQYIWQAVKASPLDNSIILKDLVPAKQYHVRLVGSIFDVIQESKLMTFTTMGDVILVASKPTTAANSNGQSTRTEP
ncbi:protein sidekick-2-like [Actinia tenebrosa]|uniref:Protein sidekick-2-like n=1 Tax=Actinia tenebrosa TaxID=6105 RepID=A0A6P8IJ14_ACTTE|nr:protein sidekick-2-like [Actinia tenebrosa]